MSTVRVHSPTPLLFLCGGPVDVRAVKPPSLREAFTRVLHEKAYRRYTMLLAEQLNAFFPKGNYQDILTFEAHIAQISELIVLFSESFGSAAELGAFAMVPDIAHRLLVVIDDEHYSASSFISLGPIRALENEFGRTSICVLHRNDIGIPNIRQVGDVKIDVLSTQMQAAIRAREQTSRERTTFDPRRPGHIIKFVVGLIQNYGALTIDEIAFHLDCLGLATPLDTLKNYLLCAEFADWIMQDKRGIETYFSALDRNKALQFESRKDREKLDKIRWQAAVMEHWKTTDGTRFSSIQAAMARG
ncbi:MULTISPECIES: retron St85 family effector protein [unclassified Neorhizobium]|uniref:retron St85 family effector protein n=1 Tax=unclassified Neorhizobium TaxID=2629175 RepID=UPI001FF1CB7F|nr:MULTISPECIES: retron St85 family effector protein [unclassified Neorhizobium]MCJ9673528.1 retron St85 family effector protein [Neorhizobium sp. SHOUNA12B]MCJ9746653.1 retron St85 family effector protein [Neorhizobium sp. SHOUNA12A]